MFEPDLWYVIYGNILLYMDAAQLKLFLPDFNGRHRHHNTESGTIHNINRCRLFEYFGSDVSRYHRNDNVLGQTGIGSFQLATHQERTVGGLRYNRFVNWYICQY